MIYAFDNFTLDPSERRLSHGETSVSVTPKMFDVLLHLVRNKGRLLRKEDLLASVWPETAVEESNLTVAISALRKVLGEWGEGRYIETVPKAGYRFVAQVTEVNNQAVAAEAIPEAIVVSDPLGQSSFGRHRLAFFALLVLVVGVGAWRLWMPLEHPGQSVAVRRRLAILPFRNLRTNSEDQYLSLSLADAVITRLNSIHELIVRPSYDIQRYINKDVDLSVVASDLGVDTVLAATFIHEGDDLRITCQLVDIRTRNIVWNGAFDVKYNKLLAVQEKVAQQIVSGLRLGLSPSEAARLRAADTVNPVAYEYYLRGIDLYATSNFHLASQLLEKAVQLAPNYGPAWAQLGRAYTASASFNFGGNEAYRDAETAFKRAITLEPDAIDSWVYMANMFTDTCRVEQAVPLLRKAIRADSSHAESHWELGYAYRFAGMLQQSTAECEYARRLDPAVKLTSSTLNGYLYLGLYDRFLESLPGSEDQALIVFYRGFGEYYQKHYDRALSNFDRAYALDPAILQARIGKAISSGLRHKQQGDDLLRALEMKTRVPGAYDPEAIYKIAQAYAVLGDRASALRVLRCSVEHGFFPYPYLQTDPLLDTLRREPAFLSILEIARQRHQAFATQFF